MAKKATVGIILVVVLAAGVGAGFWWGRASVIKEQAELKETITKPVSVNPVENLPESNPFKEVETNPFAQGYKNPFSEE